MAKEEKQRASVRLKMEKGVVLLRYGGVPSLACPLQDISEGGCSIVAPLEHVDNAAANSWKRILAPNRPVSSEIEAPPHLNHFQIDGEIRSLQPCPGGLLLGLRFRNVDPRQRELINQAVLGMASDKVRGRSDPALATDDIPPPGTEELPAAPAPAAPGAMGVRRATAFISPMPPPPPPNITPAVSSHAPSPAHLSESAYGSSFRRNYDGMGLGGLGAEEGDDADLSQLLRTPPPGTMPVPHISSGPATPPPPPPPPPPPQQRPVSSGSIVGVPKPVSSSFAAQPGRPSFGAPRFGATGIRVGGAATPVPAAPPPPPPGSNVGFHASEEMEELIAPPPAPLAPPPPPVADSAPLPPGATQPEDLHEIVELLEREGGVQEHLRPPGSEPHMPAFKISKAPVQVPMSIGQAMQPVQSAEAPVPQVPPEGQRSVSKIGIRAFRSNTAAAFPASAPATPIPDAPTPEEVVAPPPPPAPVVPAPKAAAPAVIKTAPPPRSTSMGLKSLIPPPAPKPATPKAAPPAVSKPVSSPPPKSTVSAKLAKPAEKEAYAQAPSYARRVDFPAYQLELVMMRSLNEAARLDQDADAASIEEHPSEQLEAPAEAAPTESEMDAAPAAGTEDLTEQQLNMPNAVSEGERDPVSEELTHDIPVSESESVPEAAPEPEPPAIEPEPEPVPAATPEPRDFPSGTPTSTRARPQHDSDALIALLRSSSKNLKPGAGAMPVPMPEGHAAPPVPEAPQGYFELPSSQPDEAPDPGAMSSISMQAAEVAKPVEQFRGRKVGEVLVKMGKLTDAAVQDAATKAKAAGQRLGRYLLREGMVNPDELCRGLALQSGLPMTDLNGAEMPPEALQLLPYPVLNQYEVVPFDISARVICVASGNPLPPDAVAQLKQTAGRDVEVFLAREDLVLMMLDTLRPQDDNPNRRAKRLEAALPVMFQFCNRLGRLAAEIVYEGQTTDVSEGGLMVHGPASGLGNPEDIRRRGLCVRFMINYEGRDIQALCGLRYIQPNDRAISPQDAWNYGLQILEMSTEDRRKWKEVCVALSIKMRDRNTRMGI